MKKDRQLQKLIKKLVEISFMDGKLVESQVTKSIKVLKTLPKYQVVEVLSEYLKQLKRLQRQHTMFIETVIPLNSIQLKKIKKIVEKKAGGERSRTIKVTKVVTSINPQILGGFKLRIGDEIWDETILGKINQVKEAITGQVES